MGPQATDGDRYHIADAAELGLDPERLARVLARARQEIDEGLLPSCQLALARDGRLALYETLGDAAPDSRYVIFSMTKGVIAGAIWLLVGSGQLHWDDRIADIVPAFATNGKDVITLEQVLTHTSGFPMAPLPTLEGATSAGRCARFERWRLNWEPGTQFEYHPTSAHWVLAEVIERVSGEDFRDFVHGHIIDPLGLRSFRLGVPEGPAQADINPLVAVGEVPTPDEVEAIMGFRLDLTELLGEVTTPALLSFNEPATMAVGLPGGGGISTAADMALYYQSMLHNDRDLWDPRVLAEGQEPVNDFPDPVLGHPAHRSRGLMVAGDPPDAQKRGFGHGVSPRTYGHDGAGGQLAWVDPESGISFCYLTNGLDEHVIRQARRGLSLNSKAAACLAG